GGVEGEIETNRRRQEEIMVSAEERERSATVRELLHAVGEAEKKKAAAEKNSRMHGTRIEELRRTLEEKKRLERSNEENLLRFRSALDGDRARHTTLSTELERVRDHFTILKADLATVKAHD